VKIIEEECGGREKCRHCSFTRENSSSDHANTGTQHHKPQHSKPNNIPHIESRYE
jgi:hypothetical protein